MPVYKYNAIDENGKLIQGILDAESPRGVSDKLKRQGAFLSSLHEIKESKTRSILPFKGVSISELSITTRQFSALISAGLPLEESLSVLSEQTEDVRLGRILAQVKERVSEGSSLANALGEHKNVFSDLYVNIVRAGESSGTLNVVLLRLADFLEKQAALASRVRSALVYPLFMFFIGGGVLFFTMTYVIPKIADIFEESGNALPIATVVLIKVSSFLANNVLLILLAALLIVVAAYRFKKTKRGRMFFDRLSLKIPIFGKITTMVVISRFTRTLGTLLASGIPLLDALKIGGAVMGNEIYGKTLQEVGVSVREGADLATPLRDSGIFPPLVTRMIAVGEQTGEMEVMLVRIADIYDEQVETTVSSLTSLMEPVMIMVIGAIMGFIVFAVLLPIFSLTSTIG